MPGSSSDLSRSGVDGGGSGPVEEKVTNRPLFLGQGDIFRRKTKVGGRPRAPPHLPARLACGPRHQVMRAPRGLSSSRLRFPGRKYSKKNTGWLVSNLADISLRAFLKPKTGNWHCGILLIG